MAHINLMVTVIIIKCHAHIVSGLSLLIVTFLPNSIIVLIMILIQLLI